MQRDTFFLAWQSSKICAELERPNQLISVVRPVGNPPPMRNLGPSQNVGSIPAGNVYIGEQRQMSKKSEHNQNNKLPDEPSIFASGSFPYPQLSPSEEREAKIARFAQSVLSEAAWFDAANELIAAMGLLEPPIERYWKCVNAQLQDQNSEAEPEHSLVNVHMMLAGFAIENLCKGYLMRRLSPKEREGVKAGVLPESLKTHRLVDLVERTGIARTIMKLSESEKDLVKRLGEAVFWRGRYPSATSHEGTSPFRQMQSDIRRIKRVLQKLRRHVGAKYSYRVA
jgi:hypothetical protein